MPNTLAELAQIVETLEAFERFLVTYRDFGLGMASHLPVVFRKRASAYLQLFPAEIQTLVRFAVRWRLEWDRVERKLYCGHYTDDMLSALKDLAVEGLEYSADEEDRTLEIGLYRIIGFDFHDKLLQLEYGHWKGIVPADCWQWMCDQGIYDPQEAMLHTRLHQLAQCYCFLDDVKNTDRFDNLWEVTRQEYEGLQSIQEAHSPEKICEALRYIQGVYPIDEQEKRWQTMVWELKGVFPPAPKPSEARRQLIRQLHQGVIPQNLPANNPVLHQFVDHLERSNGRFFVSIQDMLSVNDLPFLVYHLLQSNRCQAVLDCFPQVQWDKLMQCLRLMFGV